MTKIFYLAWKADPGGALFSTCLKYDAQLECTEAGSTIHDKYISSTYAELVPFRNGSAYQDIIKFVFY
jgi:hypothetical protein